MAPALRDEFETFYAWDPQSGCRVDMLRLADGRFAIQFDKVSEPICKTLEELLAECPPQSQEMRWIPFELLRKHILNAHADMSYVELAAR